MAQNYISRGEVIRLTTERSYAPGFPYRINGFNGVALQAVRKGGLLSFQLEGVFEFPLAGVEPGDPIYIYGDNTLHSVGPADGNPTACHIFGRAVTGTESNPSTPGKFNCRLLQS